MSSLIFSVNFSSTLLMLSSSDFLSSVNSKRSVTLKSSLGRVECSDVAEKFPGLLSPSGDMAEFFLVFS